MTELLFGSYPEAVIEKLDQLAKSDNVVDVALSGVYNRMKKNMVNYFVRAREQER